MKQKVDSMTGQIAPLDQLAERAAAVCKLPLPVFTPIARGTAFFPSVVTGEQAQLRVWIATYDCFDPKPERASFTVYVDNPQRWLVEGKTETVYYGLWVVDSSTATITPRDRLARETAAKTCYQVP